MKKLLILSLLTIFHFGVYAQNEVFRIDSIPQQGILLDKGWKFHAGDNPDFAKPDFDDSKWESIDPTKDIDKLPQIKKAGNGYFRIKLKIDSLLFNTIVSLEANQILASEFYLNGKQFGSFGEISTLSKNIKAYNPHGGNKSLNQVLHFYTGNSNQVVLAVKFAMQPFERYKNHLGNSTPCLKLMLFISD